MGSISGSISAHTGGDAPVKSRKHTCFHRVKYAVINSDIPSFTGSLGGMARAIKNIVNPLFEMSENAQMGIGATQFLAAWSLPFEIYEFGEHISGFLFGDKGEAKLDHGLGIIGSVAEIADKIADIAEAVELVSGHGAPWAGPLSLAAACLSPIFIAMHGKSIHQNKKSLKSLKAAKGDREELIAALKKHKYSLGSNAGIKVDKVISKLEYLQDDANLPKVYKGLKNRVKTKQDSHVLGIVITIVGFVATVILFSTPLGPWVIAGCALLITVYLLSISKMATDYFADRQFKQLLKKNL